MTALLLKVWHDISEPHPVERMHGSTYDEHQRSVAMKVMVFGMFAMMDATLWLLAVETTITWERQLWYALVGGTFGVVANIALYGVETATEIARRSIAAIALACAFGPLVCQLCHQWGGVEINPVALVAACAFVSMAGPYAVMKYGQRALDNSVSKGLKMFDINKPDADQQ